MTMKSIIQRWTFIFLLTTIAVFFSEKAYWYPQGFAIGELILFYAVPVAVCLWAIEHFRVVRLSQLVLIAGLYAFLVEGMLTPVIFEAGLFDPIMPAYFIGWHGLLSILFGWYLLRNWLVQRQWGRLLFGCTLFGLFWGMWSLTYWLPEQASEWERSTVWLAEQFGIHALVFTGMLIVAHWLLDYFDWKRPFQFTNPEKAILLLILLFFYVTLSFLAAPLGFLKLGVLLTAVFLPLARASRQSSVTFLQQQVGKINKTHLLILLAMPLLATLIYGWGLQANPSEQTLRDITELTTITQALAGAGLFLWAMVREIRPFAAQHTASTA